MPQAHKVGTRAVSVWLDDADRSLLKEIVASGRFNDQSDFLRKQIRKWAEIIREEERTTNTTPTNKEKTND